MLGDLSILVLGFIVLIIGADWLVRSASKLARSLGVSDLVVGLTVVAFGTSAPELVVSLFAAIKGSADLSIGNIVGSNISNILLILGISSIINPLFAARGTVWKEIPFMLFAVGVLIVLCNDVILTGADYSAITRADGLLLLLLFAVFLVYIAKVSKDIRAGEVGERPQFKAKSLGLLLLGFTMIILGSRWVVSGAINLAGTIGISENLIGLSVIAIGTSLPELATSAVAAYKKNSEIAVGNIVGSNIINVFFILGISALASPLPCNLSLNSDLAVLGVSSVLLFLAMFLGKPKHHVQKFEGVFFVVLYISYMIWIIKRG